MSPDDPRHGTFAGLGAHHREGSAYCDTCRAFRAEKQRQYRKDPERSADDRRRSAARHRALTRLAHLHPDDYQRLYLEEIGPPLMAAPAENTT